MSYNKDTDYQEQINEAVKKGDYVTAAKLEKTRNEKIDSEGLDYEKTNRYSGWLDDTDYSVVLKKQMNSGASRDTVSKTLKKRVKKASGTEGLIHYAYDDVYDEAVKYIMGADDFRTSGKREEYKNSYSKDINNLLNKILKRKEFSYNPFEDDIYKYYKEAYLREGERSMEDILGKLSVNTGGNVSSYAAGAALSAADYYNSKVADIIPELYSLNYDMYLDSVSNDFKELEALNTLSENEYEKYLDRVESFEKDREFDYKKFIDSLEDEKYRKEREIEEERYVSEKELENERYKSEKELENERYKSETERKKEVEDREYNLSLDKFENEKAEYLSDYDLALKKILKDEEDSQKDREYKEKLDKIKIALDKWKTLGYLDSESAKILNLSPNLRVKD
ncbi:MAG: hypothetical protein IKA17_04470 [Clostridia bacterium]|nr:hypothetical protein [Clostridia bacterium]